MFTGIVLDIGTVQALESLAGDLRLTITTQRLPLERVAIGDSVAVSGVCLTVISRTANQFAADVSRETLAVTTLHRLVVGSRVNLELALRVGDPLGGHLVSGHVDGLAQLVSAVEDARSRRLRFRLPAELARFVAVKGSVTIDGVSLTVNAVDTCEFELNLIPHTLTVTTLGQLRAGDAVNIEIDQMARYAERLLGFERSVTHQGS
ncbi:MAG TPA: riboflavin synthase [Steroidobacteraceae bacterium]|nr:riboflavin synthase [Steroidobacteraceae bacterium]HPF26142.1 riboflavin synthase [Steroidobacteraceae bacterium]HRX88216.1 riboflavin synthase [Steroidobacteraceae bacterium]